MNLAPSWKHVVLSAVVAVAILRGSGLRADPQAVTFQQVLDYVNLEVKEEKILKLVHESPTIFTLGQDQIRQLKAAGASDALIAALQKKGEPASTSDQLAISDVRDFVLILDCSGSMRDEAARGVTKWEAAQKAAIDIVRGVPDNRRLAFIVYGHDLTKRCQAVELLRPLGPLDENGKADLERKIGNLRPAGDTPIGASLNMAAGLLRETQDLAKVVVITDGVETCKGDPEGEASKLAAMPHLKGGVDVIGFGLKPAEVASVRKIAEAGRGKFYDAGSLDQFRDSVQEVKEKLTKPSVTTADETGLSALDRLNIKQLSDKNVDVRSAAARGLKARKVKAAVPQLANLVSNEVWDLGGSRPESYLGNSEVDQSKIEALNALIVIDPAAADKALLEGLKADRGQESFTWYAHNLGLRKVKAAVPTLSRAVSDEVWVKSGRAFAYLGYGSHLKELRKIAALANLKKIDPEAAEKALLDAAESKNDTVRAWATEELGKLASDSK